MCPRRLVGVALLALVAAAGSVSAGETVSITLPADAISLAPGPGADVTATQCAFCHSLDYITTQPQAPAALWRGVVTKMAKVYGAPVSDADARTIAEYLATRYGR